MTSIYRDLRFALRMLLKSPGFTLVTVLILAVGLGATIVVFSWIRGFLLEPLTGVPGQGRVRHVVGQTRGGDWTAVSAPDFRDLTRSGLPAPVAVFSLVPMDLRVGEQPERVWGTMVSGNYFDVLGVRAAVGRTFRPEEDTTPGTHPVIVLSHELWQRLFQGDPDVVGRTVQINRQAFTVVGVAAPDFRGALIGLRSDLFLPLAMQPLVIPGGSQLEDRANRGLLAVARLPSGVSQEKAQAALDTATSRLAAAYPDVNTGYRLHLFQLRKSPMGPSEFFLPLLSVLGSMALLILLLACANVANLLLVRALGRRKEIAVRLSLGAGRGLLLRQLLIEGMLLALLAGVLGLALASWGRQMLIAFTPTTNLPVDPVFPFDLRLLGFAAVLSLATGVLFSLAPALQITSPDLASVLRDEAGAVSGGRKGLVRSSLVVAQIMLSCLLLIAAGLFVRSLGHATEIDPGFSARNVLLATVDLFPGGYNEERGRVFHRELLRRAAALPGVESASLASSVPLDFGGAGAQALDIEGYAPGPDEEVMVGSYTVGPDYLRTLGIPLVSGREFTARDDEKAPPAMIINETMAQRYWAGSDPIGRKVRIAGRSFTVVGVAGDGKYLQLTEAPKPHFYLSVFQSFVPAMTIHLRTAGNPAALTAALRREMQGLDADLPLTGVKTLREHLRISIFTQRLAAGFLGAIGALALVLATVGLSSLLRYAVKQRTREIGVRVALGAQPQDITRLVVGQGIVLALIGLGLGLVLAFGVTRFLASLLLGVSATDPVVFVAVVAILAAVAALASWLPARIAARVDPIVALKRE
jgi:predicted permease